MRLIDISQALNENTPIYPGDYKTSLTKYKTIEKNYYNSYLLQTCLHTGTHVDIPMHLLNDNKTVDKFPIEHFIGKGVLLDVRGESPIGMKKNYQEMISEHDIVLLYTGFDEYFFQEKYFTQHPAITDELADFFLFKKIKTLGMDMPSPDYPPFKIHKALLSNEIFILENLTNLQELKGITNFEVIAFPLKISAEAGFVRAVCKVN